MGNMYDGWAIILNDSKGCYDHWHIIKNYMIYLHDGWTIILNDSKRCSNHWYIIKNYMGCMYDGWIITIVVVWLWTKAPHQGKSWVRLMTQAPWEFMHLFHGWSTILVVVARSLRGYHHTLRYALVAKH